MAKKNFIDDLLDRAGDINRDLSKVGRKALRKKKKSRKSGRKLAKRNSRDIERLATEVAVLTRQVSLLAAHGSTATGTEAGTKAAGTRKT
jgi:hypothetical protein